MYGQNSGYNQPSDPLGFAAGDLAALVSKIDNVLKDDGKTIMKADSTFDRETPIPKLNIPAPQPYKSSPSRVHSQYQPPTSYGYQNP